jgi:hypothetical protein
MRDPDQEERWFRFFEGMQIAAPFLVLVFALLILLAVASCAGAAECLPSSDAVKAMHPGFWASWSGRMPGHRGQHCWFPKEERREGRRSAGQGKQAIPLPRHRPDFEQGRRLAAEPLPSPSPLGVPISMTLWELGWR